MPLQLKHCRVVTVFVQYVDSQNLKAIINLACEGFFFSEIFSFFLLKLFRLSGRLREIHTRKRDSQVVEYGLFAICSPANSPNSHHAGASIKKEVALTAQKRLERANSDPTCGRFVFSWLFIGSVTVMLERNRNDLHLN